MKYVISEEECGKLEAAMKRGRDAVRCTPPTTSQGEKREWIAPTLAQIDAALSLLAGLPKVPDAKPGSADVIDYPMDTLCATCGRCYGEHWGPLCGAVSPSGTFVPVPPDAAMKEHPQP